MYVQEKYVLNQMYGCAVYLTLFVIKATDL